MSSCTVEHFGNLVGSTTVTTLYARSHSQSVDNPIPYDDQQAEQAWRSLSDKVGEQHLLSLSLTDRASVVGTVRRGQLIDRACYRFFTLHPDGQMVSLGIGLCNRRARLANIDAPFYGVDIPEVIELRKEVIADDDVKLIDGSLTTPTWLSQIPPERPTLVVAEGVLMYLPLADINALLVRIGDRFGNDTTFVADAFGVMMIKFPHPIQKITGVAKFTGSAGAEGLARRAPGWKVIGETDLVAPLGQTPALFARLHRVLLRTPMYYLAELVHRS